MGKEKFTQNKNTSKMSLTAFHRKKFAGRNDGDQSTNESATPTQSETHEPSANVVTTPRQEEAKKPEPKNPAPLQGVKFWKQRKQLDHDRIISVAPTLK